LFISILSAASCGHPLQVIVAPRGALTWRLSVLIVLAVYVGDVSTRRSGPGPGEHALKEAI
jgi:hypothetical protein